MKIKMSKKLRTKLDAAKETDEFWMDSAKLDFAIALEHERLQTGKSYGDVANSMKTSPAYISKVFRGDANLTIESMVKIARHVGCRLEIKLNNINKKSELAWPNFYRQKAMSDRNQQVIEAFKKDTNGVQEGQFHPEIGADCSNDPLHQRAA